MAKKKAVRRENGRGTVEKRYLQATERYHSDRLFNDPKGQQSTKMTYDMYRGRFTNVMKEMGFKGLTPHCTRHTFSTQAKRCGMDFGISIYTYYI